MKYYTGIGSRDTPIEICKFFERVAKFLSQQDYILRSGHAKGSDQAFENGCDFINGNKEIYLPWSNFNDSNSLLVVDNPKAFDIAKKFHPYWSNLSSGAKKLQARNSHQVLGINLDTPSKFVVCYTKNGRRSGGTGQALRVSDYYKIPIFDAGLFNNDHELIASEFIKFYNNIKESNHEKSNS